MKKSVVCGIFVLFCASLAGACGSDDSTTGTGSGGQGGTKTGGTGGGGTSSGGTSTGGAGSGGTSTGGTSTGGTNAGGTSTGGSAGSGGSAGAGASGGNAGDGGLCGLPADPGPCDAAIPRWFFNSQTGKCESFVYGGCQGNANNFQTPDACVQACAPNTTNACDVITCDTATQCVFVQTTPLCAQPCNNGGACPQGSKCGCGASCPSCKDCIQVCVAP